MIKTQIAERKGFYSAIFLLAGLFIMFSWALTPLKTQAQLYYPSRSPCSYSTNPNDPRIVCAGYSSYSDYSNSNSNSNYGYSANQYSSTYPYYDNYNYNSNYNYNNSYNYNGSPLSVSCYASPSSGNVGDYINWRSSVSGGNSSYYYYWTGTDNLLGSGSSVSKYYTNTGTKNAVLTVTSGGQSLTRDCTSAVIYDYRYGNSYNSNYYPYNNYNNNYGYNSYSYNNYYAPLSVSCVSNVTYSPAGSYVTWTAYPSGGSNNYYTYSWSGTDNIYGSQMSINQYYSLAGIKYATVTVSSNGQQASAQCSNTVTIGAAGNYGNTYSYNSTSLAGIQLSCFADVPSDRVGTPVVWRVEVSGNPGNLSYIWSGTEGLTGNQSSVVKTYSTIGVKNATVTVYSGDRSLSKTCSSSITVRSPSLSAAQKKVTVNSTKTASQKAVLKSATTSENSLTALTASSSEGPVPELAADIQKTVNTPPSANNESISAVSFFSLKNVPWGWVALLVILVLFGAVLYLILNKKNI